MTARISWTCMLPSISYYFLDKLFVFVRLQNLSRDESKAEASHYYTSKYPVCLWSNTCCCCDSMVRHALLPFPSLSSPSFYVLLFTAHKRPPPRFQKLVALQRYFLYTNPVSTEHITSWLYTDTAHIYSWLYTTLAYRAVRVHRVIVFRVMRALASWRRGSRQLRCESSSKELVGEHDMPTGVVD